MLYWHANESGTVEFSASSLDEMGLFCFCMRFPRAQIWQNDDFGLTAAAEFVIINLYRLFETGLLCSYEQRMPFSERSVSAYEYIKDDSCPCYGGMS